MRAVLLALALAGCGSDDASPTNRPARAALPKLEKVLMAVEPCRSKTKKLLVAIQLNEIGGRGAIGAAKDAGEDCLQARMNVLKFEMPDPAEHLCIGIASANQAVLTAVRRSFEEPSLDHYRQLSRFVKECGMALAT